MIRAKHLIHNLDSLRYHTPLTNHDSQHTPTRDSRMQAIICPRCGKGYHCRRGSLDMCPSCADLYISEEMQKHNTNTSEDERDNTQEQKHDWRIDYIICRHLLDDKSLETRHCRFRVCCEACYAVVDDKHVPRFLYDEDLIIENVVKDGKSFAIGSINKLRKS